MADDRRIEQAKYEVFQHSRDLVSQILHPLVRKNLKTDKATGVISLAEELHNALSRYDKLCKEERERELPPNCEVYRPI